MNQPPSLAIIIVTWNTRELLARCLASIAKNAPALRHTNVQTVVVDNASADGTPTLVKAQFPWVTLIENQSNAGFARANNQAIRQCQGTYLLLLNSDAELLDNALVNLLAFMEQQPQAAAAGPLLLNADGSLQPSAHPMLTPERELWRLSFLDRLIRRATYDMTHWDRRHARRVEVLKGACLLLRRAALDEVGLLDESYFMYTEEVDLCFRLAQAGWERWWVPQAQVIHYGAASSKQAEKRMYVQLYRSKIQFYRKFGGSGRANRFKQFVRLAYRPRLAVATLLAPFSGRQSEQAETYRQLLAELPAM